ncbi:MAG: HEPN domain-containing protein [Candidatus Heimdallarchaeota archaeon]|nr:HEPN domain-containing protein [Candidatus Heimdallarchaeota archaeon]
MTRQQDWLKYSQELYDIAELLINNQKYSWACFTLNQASAAALKSILSNIDESTFGDNLIALLRSINNAKKVPEDVTNACHSINIYFTLARDLENKPDGTPITNFSQKDAKQAINDTMTILRFAHHMAH